MDDSLSAQERAGLVVWLLAQRPMTTAAVAGRVGLSHAGARVLLAKLSRVVPIYYDRAGNAWRFCPADESNMAGGRS